MSFVEKCLLCVGLVFCVSFGYSQEMYYRMYAQGTYDKLDRQLNEVISNQPDNIVFNHVYGKLYATPDFKKYNLGKSYDYLLKAKTLYSQAPTSEKERLRKLSVSSSVLQADFDTVCDKLLQDAIASNSVSAMNQYIQTYSKAKKEYRDIALQVRDSVAFADAKKQGTIDALNVFLSNYSKAVYVPQAQVLRDSLVFVTVMKENSMTAFRAFLQQYPQSKYAKEIQTIYFQRLFVEQTRAGDYKSYENFIKSNPKNDMLPLAIEKMIEIAKTKNDIRLFQKTVEYSKGNHFNYALYEFYKFFTQDGEYLTLYTFSQLYPRSYLDTLLAKDMKIAQKAERLEFVKPFDTAQTKLFDEYIMLAAPKEKAFVALQKMISPHINNKEWSKAIVLVKKYEPYFGKNDVRIQGLLEILTRPYDRSVVVKPIPGKVNTEEGGEYSPIITSDNKYLYFCGSFRPDNIGGEDIFVSEFIQNEWAQPTIVQELSTSTNNEAVISISTCGTKMIFFREGVIFYSEKTPFGWAPGVSVSQEINNAEWTADAMITSDGNAIIFASVRSEGMNYYTKMNATLGLYHGAIHHQSDLYVSLKTPQGWGKPINLGTSLNTIYTERSPFLHHDMKTLYFSSDGHGGLGNLDVYRSERLSDTCWDCWSTPVNLGREINNSEENWGYRIAPDGKNFYYAARQTGQKYNDILMVTIPEKFLPDAVVHISGKLLDKQNKPVSATIIYEDLELGEIIGEAHSDPVHGTYHIVLPHGKMYGYFIDDEQYFPQSQFIDLTKTKGTQHVHENIVVITYEQMKRDKIPVRLNNLFFDTNKSDLLPYSIPELKRTAYMIQKNQLRIEISGHTDSVGDDDFNMELSLRRARAVRDFLVSQGCSSSLFEIVGHGERKPATSNDTPEGRAQNRRVELRFL